MTYEVATKKSILKPTAVEKNRSITNPYIKGIKLWNLSGIANIQYEKIKNPKFSSINSLTVN